MTVEFIGEEGSLYAAEVSREGRFLSDAVIAHIADIAQERGGGYEGEGEGSVRIGGKFYDHQIVAGGRNSIAVGSAPKAWSEGSIAMGALAMAGREGAHPPSQIAIGSSASATGSHSVAIGHGAMSHEDYTMVLGVDRVGGGSTAPVYTVHVPGRLRLSNLNTGPDDAATIGMLDSALDRAYPSRSEGGNFSVALGRISRAGADAVAIGGYANSLPDRAVAVGYSAKAGGDWSTAVGADASSGGSGSIALGGSSSAVGASSVAIGGGLATGLAGVAIGASTSASGILAMSIGALAGVAPANTAVIGPEYGLNEDMTPTGDPYTVRVPGAVELSEHNTLPEHAARRDWVEQYVADNGGEGPEGPPGPAPTVEWDGSVLVVEGERSPDLTGPEGPEGPEGPTGPLGPPGAVASPEDYSLIGPGRPDVPASTGDLVTASTPVGATYTSTDGAGVGAFVWRKRPDGTWEVVDGDTGWRGMATETDSTLYLRRKNDMIHWQGTRLGGASSRLLAVPDWAKPNHSAWMRFGAPIYRHGKDSGAMVLASGSGIALAHPEYLWLNSGAGSDSASAVNLSYSVVRPWPSTLPGTPA